MTSPTPNYSNDLPVANVLMPMEGPVSAASAPVRTQNLSEKQIQQLIDQGFTKSLAESLNQTKREFALRIWVVDNSGSMQTADGHRIVNEYSGSSVRFVDCTRWEEIRSTVDYHIRMASIIDAPTRFRFLNSSGTTPSQFSIADPTGPSLLDRSSASAMVRRMKPHGCTPLTQHVLDIHREVSAMAPTLMANGQRVAIIIATDGLPTDECGYGGQSHQRDFVDALRRLEGLPVWLVIRLCTDDDKVVNFYNDLDNILELSVDVLDDFVAEAHEIHEHNTWLNYALPLHRLREMGYHDRLFDLIDQQRLTKSQVRDYCTLLLGYDCFDGVPDPSVNWKSFSKNLSRALEQLNQRQYDPIKMRPARWVSVNKLNRTYDRR